MKAFPVSDQHNSNINEGMDLRDYFAAKAMSSIYARLGGSPIATNHDSSLDMVAIASYEIADAMMKAREA